MSKTERNGYEEQTVALAGSASNIEKMKQKSSIIIFVFSGVSTNVKFSHI